MPITVAVKFRAELGKIGKVLVDELDNLYAYLSKAGIILGTDIPACLAISTGVQAVPTAVWTLLQVAARSAIDDPFQMMSGSGARAPIAGLYQVHGFVGWAASAAGNSRGAAIYVNSLSKHYVIQPPIAGGVLSTLMGISALVRCSQGDVINLYGYQDSGGNLNSNYSTAAGASFNANHLHVSWVRP